MKNKSFYKELLEKQTKEFIRDKAGHIIKIKKIKNKIKSKKMWGAVGA